MTYLLTIVSVELDSQGLRVTPGIRLSETRDRPAIAQMMQGSELELRLPDGTTRRTVLLTYGVSVWRGEDGAIYTNEDLADPEIKLTLPADIAVDELPVGTEVWLVNK